MSNESDEITDIIAQLKHLQIQETKLLQRLEQLNEGKGKTTESTTSPRGFSLGDLVQIKNPRPLQAKQGIIVKINIETNRVSVKTKNGSKISRIPDNLLLIN